ncbi:MAG: SPOR domain-containing protein [Bacteroidia bacterium]|nr:SPOR domain-containing protein [Bacteroidia bacterium]
MKIDKHISALLFEHDCVIVPDFGGFVSSYTPAKLHVTQHIFNPPHKNISFNKHLKKSDGLLAHCIAEVENKSFNEAGSIINSYVVECNGLLKKGERVTIEQVGTLFYDAERNIQFEPDKTVNYLIESFGMTPVQSLPVKRDSIDRRPEKKFIDKEPIRQEKKRKKIVPVIISALTLLLAVSLIFLSVQSNVLSGINFSSLNPFAPKLVALYSPRTEIKPALTEKDFNAEKSNIKIDSTETITEIAFVNDVDRKLPVRLKENEATTTHDPDKTAVVSTILKQNSAAKYHIVCGCFKVEANAHNFVAMLKAKNLNASIIGRNKDGLYIVSSGNFTNQDKAYNELARVRTTTAAWMLVQ